MLFIIDVHNLRTMVSQFKLKEKKKERKKYL